MSSFPELLKTWRKQRRFSQLALALEANVSARHLACLETGKARPSSEMVQRLAETLELPLSARNQLLSQAGFAARYEARAWDSAELAPVRSAVEWTLSRHAPWPGLAVDRLWRVLQLNETAELLFGALGIHRGDSLLGLLLSDRAPSLVENWPEVAHHAALRLRTESAAQGGVPELDRAASVLAAVPVPGGLAAQAVIPTVFRLGAERLRLFSTLAQFGSPEDLTLDDLRIELYFPADPQSERTLRALASAAAKG